MAVNYVLNDVIGMIKACITLRAKPPTAEEVGKDFEEFFGAPIPWGYFGYPHVKAFLMDMPDVYVLFNGNREDTYIVHSQKSKHMMDLVKGDGIRRKRRHENSFGSDGASCKRMRTGSGIEAEDSTCMLINFHDYESITPLFFNHQAMGDDFFVDLAENKFGYHVPCNGPINIGKCKLDRTISELSADVKSSRVLCTKAVVMVGTSDLLRGASEREMARDLRMLVKCLKKRKVEVALLTLIKPANKYYSPALNRRMRSFNKTVRGYAKDRRYGCQVIDVDGITKSTKFAKAISRQDRFQVLSDHTRDILYGKLKNTLI